MKQNRFDRTLRSKERKYLKKKVSNIEKANTSNPREFWNYINNLGPKSSRKIPEVVETDRELNSNLDEVLSKWQSDFSKLYEKPDRTTKHYNQD